MNTLPLTIPPVLNRTADWDKSRSQYLRQASVIAKGLEPPTSKFTLDVAKSIWATYSGGKPTAGNAVETEVVRHANALELNLGVEGYTAFYGADMTPQEPLASDNVVAKTAVAQHNSPTSERDVDELLSTVDDARYTPGDKAQSVPPNNGIHHSDLRDVGSQVSMDLDTDPVVSSSPIHESQRGSLLDPTNDMRGDNMNTFQEAIRLRYPHLNVDLEKLKKTFATKPTDSEVQQFLRVGREVMENLIATGTIDEAKRKLETQEWADESDARRFRRRIDKSSSPVLTENPKPTDGVDESRPLSGTPTVSSTMPTTQAEGPSNGLGIEGLSTSTHNDTQHENSGPFHLDEDVPMSPSPSSQQPPGPPHSPVLFTPDHHKDQIADQNSLHEPADKVAMKTDDEMPDFGEPRILLAKVGQPMADVTDVSFDVNERLCNAVRRWAHCWEEYDPGEIHMRIYLTSIPTTAAEHAHRELPPNSPTSHLAESVAKINAEWPPVGTFYVSLNEGSSKAMSWGDQFFGPSSSPLDISNYVLTGNNTIRFIQLEDHSQRIFLILAMPPSDSEKRTRAAWSKRLPRMPSTIKVFHC